MPATIEFGGPFQPIQGSDLKSVDISSQINGITNQFTIAEEFITQQCFVFLNGLFQGPPSGAEITINNSTTFTIATLPLSGDSLTVVYSPFIKQS
tara:strand:+ start:508 stop:792 length:285 start_codon:yes stop_codon:yes gene_type:complete